MHDERIQTERLTGSNDNDGCLVRSSASVILGASIRYFDISFAATVIFGAYGGRIYPLDILVSSEDTPIPIPQAPVPTTSTARTTI